MKVSEFLTNTAKLIGVVAKNEPLSADEQADMFARLNSMLNSWAADRLTIFSVVPKVFNLVAGVQTYTIGVGATFNVPRPVWIQSAGLITNTNPLQPLELPVDILSDDEWAALAIKSLVSTLSWSLYYDYAFGPTERGNISLWPIPNDSTLQLALYLPTPIGEFATVDDLVHFPPGYEEAIRYNLAVRLCPEMGRPIDPVIAKIANDSFTLIQRANKRQLTLGVDSFLVGEGKGTYNWMTDSDGP